MYIIYNLLYIHIKFIVFLIIVWYVVFNFMFLSSNNIYSNIYICMYIYMYIYIYNILYIYLFNYVYHCLILCSLHNFHWSPYSSEFSTFASYDLDGLNALWDDHPHPMVPKTWKSPEIH